jgi:hypothetical protein
MARKINFNPLESFLRTSKTNLGRDSSKKEDFIKQTIEIAKECAGIQSRQGRKRVSLEESVICMKPKKPNQKGGFIMTKARSQQLDDMQKNRRKKS